MLGGDLALTRIIVTVKDGRKLESAAGCVAADLVCGALKIKNCPLAVRAGDL